MQTAKGRQRRRNVTCQLQAKRSRPLPLLGQQSGTRHQEAPARRVYEKSLLILTVSLLPASPPCFGTSPLRKLQTCLVALKSAYAVFFCLSHICDVCVWRVRIKTSTMLRMKTLSLSSLSASSSGTRVPSRGSPSLILRFARCALFSFAIKM